MPGPKVPHVKWTDELRSKLGKWGTYKKISFTEGVFNKEKDRIAPNKYETFNGKVKRPLGAFKL